MPLAIRRVVTGHDAEGRAVVQMDGPSTTHLSRRAGQVGCVIWTTETTPADNGGHEDAGLRKVGTCIPGGSVFRIVEYLPGVAPRRHRSDSIDYAVVMSGEIWLQLDDTEVLLKAGDVLVQRGTIHNWDNRGREPCVVAFVLIGAKPVEAGGHVLEATG